MHYPAFPDVVLQFLAKQRVLNNGECLRLQEQPPSIFWLSEGIHYLLT